MSCDNLWTHAWGQRPLQRKEWAKGWGKVIHGVMRGAGHCIIQVHEQTASSQGSTLTRPQEAPTIWCPQKSQNLPSNPHGWRPQIHTFGQGSSHEFQKGNIWFFFAPSPSSHLLLYHFIQFGKGCDMWHFVWIFGFRHLPKGWWQGHPAAHLMPKWTLNCHI